jgi:hypothetical protein
MLSKYFNNPEVHFQPNGTALKAWLSTNKNPMNNAGVIRPGLFNEPSIAYFLGFLTILLIEGLATIYVNEYMDIIAIAGTIFLDISLAWLSHRMEGKIAQAQNELLFNNNTLKGDKVRRILSRYSTFKNILHFLIMLSALYKGLSFYSTYDTLDSVVISICFAYLFGGFLHIRCTGYSFAYWSFRYIMYMQFAKFMDSDGTEYAYDKQNSRLTSIETSINLTTANTFKHAIVKDENGCFYFKTLGILLDTEISELVSKQLTKEQQRIVAVEAVRLQCEQLTW